MISDRAAGKLIAIVAIMVCAAVASTLDSAQRGGSMKIAGAGEGMTAEAFQPVGLKGSHLTSSR